MHLKKSTALLLSLGCYLGHSMDRYTDYRIPVIRKDNYFILEFNSFVLSLQKSLHYLKVLGSNGSTLLILYPLLCTFPVEIRLSFIGLAHSISSNVFETPWVYGQLSNVWMQVLSILKKLFFTGLKKEDEGKEGDVEKDDEEDLLTQEEELSFFPLLTRVVFFSYFKRIGGITWEVHFSKILKYWKFIHIYKFFKSFHYLGDSCILFNTASDVAVIREIDAYLLPIVGVVDSSSTLTGISYPIFCNDDSIVLNYFLLQLFISSYVSGRTSFYKQHWLLF
jgi:ribosomal protein S2